MSRPLIFHAAQKTLTEHQKARDDIDTTHSCGVAWLEHQCTLLENRADIQAFFTRRGINITHGRLYQRDENGTTFSIIHYTSLYDLIYLATRFKAEDIKVIHAGYSSEVRYGVFRCNSADELLNTLTTPKVDDSDEELAIKKELRTPFYFGSTLSAIIVKHKQIKDFGLAMDEEKLEHEWRILQSQLNKAKKTMGHLHFEFEIKLIQSVYYEIRVAFLDWLNIHCQEIVDFEDIVHFVEIHTALFPTLRIDREPPCKIIDTENNHICASNLFELFYQGYLSACENNLHNLIKLLLPYRIIAGQKTPPFLNLMKQFNKLKNIKQALSVLKPEKRIIQTPEATADTIRMAEEICCNIIQVLYNDSKKLTLGFGKKDIYALSEAIKANKRIINEYREGGRSLSSYRASKLAPRIIIPTNTFSLDDIAETKDIPETPQTEKHLKACVEKHIEHKERLEKALQNISQQERWETAADEMGLSLDEATTHFTTPKHQHARACVTPSPHRNTLPCSSRLIGRPPLHPSLSADMDSPSYRCAATGFAPTASRQSFSS